ncbi:hypothetical protein ABID65_009275 [Bradyrhizobium sp. S3.9.2]|uniref:hypothetical protein n=1 Tax=Bradyrhizobium sp. S3.9.2 TaxID=3156432 RepID=UPI00339B13E7
MRRRKNRSKRSGEIDDLRGKLIMTEHARNKDKSAAWEALPKEDRDTGHRVNDALSKVESAHNRAIQAAKSALEQAERRAKSLTGTK